MHGRHLERFVEGQRRQNSRQPPRHHRLAGARRTDEQQVVSAGRGDLERAARQELAAHIGEIGRAARRCTQRRWATGRAARAAGIVQRLDRVGERRDGVDVQARHDRGFAGVRRREQNRREAFALRRRGDRQHAARRMDRPVERQLAEQDAVGDFAPLDDALRREDAERDRQIERGAGLPHVGRRQIHRDAVGVGTRIRNCGSRRARDRGSRGRWRPAGRPS